MVLVDTSVWIDHLRRNDAVLVSLLEQSGACTHPFVVGEVALGSLRDRAGIVEALKALPQVPVATDDEVLRFIELQKLFSLGIGYIDAHLLASARLGPHVQLWTRDRRLAAVARRIGCAYAETRH